jgi:subtilisin family serine protease
MIALAFGVAAPSFAQIRSTDDNRVHSSKLHPLLAQRFHEAGQNGVIKAWVLFADKGHATKIAERDAVNALADTYNRRALARRALRRTRNGLVDTQDLPVSARYLDAVAQTGVTLKHSSKWVNGVSVIGTRDQLAQVARLPYVRSVQPVRRGRMVDSFHVKQIELPAPDGGVAGGLDYGVAFDQLQQMNLIGLHDLGFTGAGVVIGVLDTGFRRTHAAFNEPGHPIDVIAEYDFVDDDPFTGIETGDPSNQHSHGTIVLSTMAAYKPGQFVGAAYDASYILCKTEDVTAEYEAEEDNFVAGLEFIEANGGDIATASLGYIDWYTQADLDGMTAVTTIGVNTAVENGLICLSAAGNGGNDADPNTSHLIAPADAPKNITVGAVASTGGVASFSSDGPTADGRVKPEVMARGVATATVSSSNDSTYGSANGTSLSTPLVAGAVACLIQANPGWTVDQLRNRLMTTASRYVALGTFDPLYVQGYGIIDVLAANDMADCNDNGVDDAVDISGGGSNDVDGNQVPDECQDGACCRCDALPMCQALTLDTCGSAVGVFYEGLPCTNVVCPSAAPTHDNCADAITVAGGETAIDTRCATTDGPVTETEGCIFDPADAFQHDIWFTYTAACDGFIDVSVMNTDFDALVAVYCDGSDACSCPTDASTEYACNQQGDIGSFVRASVSSGNCYTIRVGGFNGAQGTGTLDIQESCLACFPTSPPQSEPNAMNKVRAVSFVAGDPGIPQAVRVTLVDLPPPFEQYEGRSYWVGAPEMHCSNSGHPHPPQPNSPPNFGCAASGEPERWYWAAHLQCTPHVMDWTTLYLYDKGIHIHSGVVVPAGTYAVETIDAQCLSTRCSDGVPAFSDPLMVPTSMWGDILKDNSTNPPGPPNFVVDISDVVGVLDKFRNRVGCAAKVRADIEPALVDLHVNITDITYTLDAAVSVPYPFAFVLPCP